MPRVKDLNIDSLIVRNIPKTTKRSSVRRKRKILILKRRKRMMDDITTSQVLGTVFYTMVVFAVGAVVGPKFFVWIGNLLPWNKN